MKHRRPTSLLALAVLLVASSSAAAAAQRTEASSALRDEDALALRARAERPADPSPFVAREALATVGAGNALFSMTGPDNAPCVRSLADVNGDGRDEVLVGIDESGTDNVFCLDGASSGTATVVWAIETADGVSGGSPYGDQCLVPSSDSDGNGSPNFLLGTAWGGRTAYGVDSDAGAALWKYDTYFEPDAGWVYSLAEMSDVTGDGVPECAFGVGSLNDGIYMVNGEATEGQAAVLWRYPAGDATYSVRNIGDVNDDGDDDVLAAIGDNADRIVCLDGGTTNPNGSVVWSHDPGTSVYACEVVPDVNGDGIDDALAVLWTLAGSAVRCLDGASGALVWSSTDVMDYAQMVDVLEDVTGDGLSEVVVSSWENAVQVLDGSDGSRVWKTEVGTTNGGDVWTARAIDDLNGDGRQDVIAGSFDYHVYALDGDTGEVFWAFDTQNRVFSVHPVGDLNGDGRPEVAVGTQDTSSQTVVWVLEGDAGIPYPGLTRTGTGVLGSEVTLEITGPAGHTAVPAFSSSTTSIVLPALSGVLGLAAPIRTMNGGIIPAGGAYEVDVTVPDDPALAGRVYFLQGLVYTGPPLSGGFTDVEEIVFEAGG